MSLTLAQLRACMPDAGERAALHWQALDLAMDEFGIESLVQRACFLAQIAHESGSLRYSHEIASGAAYDTGALAARLGNTPQADGDGQRFKGRGHLQITGRDNYVACSRGIGRDVIADPDFLETPIGAARSAAWYWREHGLNDIAALGNFGTLTKKINGGYNGLDDRIKHYVRIRRVFGL